MRPYKTVLERPHAGNLFSSLEEWILSSIANFQYVKQSSKTVAIVLALYLAAKLIVDFIKESPGGCDRPINAFFL